MKTLRKQGGFALIAGLLIVITVLSLGSIQLSQYLTKKRILNNTESFFHRVLYLKTQIHAYANDHYLQGHAINGPTIFPRRLLDLEGGYIPTCSTVDNQNGRCMKVTQTPWGEIATSDYRVLPITSPSGATYYRAELDLQLPDKNDPPSNTSATRLCLFSLKFPILSMTMHETESPCASIDRIKPLRTKAW